MDGDYRSFSQDIQLTIGHNARDLDDFVCLRIQPGHLQINPDQIVIAERHNALVYLFSVKRGTIPKLNSVTKMV